MGALSVEQIFSSIGIRVDGPRAWDEHLILSWVVTDEQTTHIIELRNGALNQRIAAAPEPGTTTFTLTRPVLIGLVTGTVDLPAAIADGTVTVDGDPAELGRLVAVLSAPDPGFAIVTP